jgi:hypothetical protein
MYFVEDYGGVGIARIKAERLAAAEAHVIRVAIRVANDTLSTRDLREAVQRLREARRANR